MYNSQTLIDVHSKLHDESRLVQGNESDKIQQYIRPPLLRLDLET